MPTWGKEPKALRFQLLQVPKPIPHLDPCWSWENSIICPAISRSCKLGYRLFRKSSKSLLLPEGMTSDIPYRKREEEKRVLLGLKRLEALLALRYLASAPGAAEMYLPLPFVSPPVGYRTEGLKTILVEHHSKEEKSLQYMKACVASSLISSILLLLC